MIKKIYVYIILIIRRKIKPLSPKKTQLIDCLKVIYIISLKLEQVNLCLNKNIIIFINYNIEERWIKFLIFQVALDSFQNKFAFVKGKLRERERGKKKRFGLKILVGERKKVCSSICHITQTLSKFKYYYLIFGIYKNLFNNLNKKNKI